MPERNEENLHGIAGYIDLISRFEAGQITAPQFEREYLTRFKNDKVAYSDDVFEILNELFYAVDDYVENPAIRTSPEDLDEDQLRERAATALHNLRGGDHGK